MGVRSHAGAPLPRARPSGPGAVATLAVVTAAFLLLVANGRPVGTPDASGAAAWLFRGAVTGFTSPTIDWYTRLLNFGCRSTPVAGSNWVMKIATIWCSGSTKNRE